MHLPDNTQALVRKWDPLLKDLSYHELSVLNRLIVDKLSLLQKAGTLMAMSKFNIGDRVTWQGSDGQTRSGIIFRLNQKTASIKTSSQGYWNVSPQFLIKTDDGG